MPIVRVTDPADPRLDEYRHLTDAELRRQVESSTGGHGIFIAEGALVLRHLLASGIHIRSVLLTERRRIDHAAALEALDAPVYVAEQSVLDAAGGFHIHRGVLAAADRPAPRRWEDAVAGATRLALLEDVNDQENLGALFRNAAGLGIDAVLLSPRCADPLYRRTVRVSMGHVLRVPWARLEPWPSALDALGASGFRLVALSPAGDRELDEVADAVGSEPTVVALGAEGPGLSDAVLARAWARARIPMASGTDSLNVAAASAIAFWRLGRVDIAGGGIGPAGSG